MQTEEVVDDLHDVQTLWEVAVCYWRSAAVVGLCGGLLLLAWSKMKTQSSVK